LNRLIARNLEARYITSETAKLPSRKTILKSLQSKDEFDVLIIGGGSTGAGAALDATLRGLKVACVEREDFSSGTSSRSTKLIWAGSRYLVQAFVELLSTNSLKSPAKSVRKFIGDFKMVLNCHRERGFLMDTQPHLTNWLPLAVPMTSWILWPPPFNFWPAALGPLGIFTAFFKFYDALGGFKCPPSHIMIPRRARRKFPQLANADIKYCSIFYEGQHDDSRTNIAIAQTAAREGASIANYCNVVRLIRAGELDTTVKPQEKNKIVAAEIRDEITGEQFILHAKTILFCGGPFTDELRKLENKEAKNIVNGAGGIHIVLPAYYAPSGIGLVDMNTSDGRFLFFLPWEGHVLIGTTDHKQTASMRPEASEFEIRWLLAEASKYLSNEFHVRREDVLSAW
jgi:glycerol-3-phosphate dehydrogenase